MATVSLCMIVKEEEAVLGRCLEIASRLADEIVIVDTGSKDRTKEIAARYTEKIFDYVWEDDFSAARNYAFEKGTKDFLMWLDADDVLPRRTVEALLELKESRLKDVDVVMLPYETAFDSSGACTFFCYRERIVRNKAGFRFCGRVHEVIPPSGRILYLPFPVEHRKEKAADCERNLRIYEDMEQAGEVFDGRALYYYGRELLSHGRMEKGEKVLEAFLQRSDGWLENRIEAGRQLAFVRLQKGEETGALQALLWTLAEDVPRAETCCALGQFFLERGKYRQAAYWYYQALLAGHNPESGAFVQEECYGFLPAISLAVCYDRLGEWERAEQYNELAGRYRPDSVHVKQNRLYFRNRRQMERQGKQRT